MSIVNAVIGGVIAVCVIAAATTLGIHGTLDGQTIAGLFGALIGGGAVAGSHAIASGKK